MTEQTQIPVVIRWVGNHWGICHAKSYQNAFRNSINNFSTRADAVRFSEANGCTVERHSYDRLQEEDACDYIC